MVATEAVGDRGSGFKVVGRGFGIGGFTGALLLLTAGFDEFTRTAVVGTLLSTGVGNAGIGFIGFDLIVIGFEGTLMYFGSRQ